MAIHSSLNDIWDAILFQTYDKKFPDMIQSAKDEYNPLSKTNCGFYGIILNWKNWNLYFVEYNIQQKLMTLSYSDEYKDCFKNDSYTFRPHLVLLETLGAISKEDLEFVVNLIHDHSQSYKKPSSSTGFNHIKI